MDDPLRTPCGQRLWRSNRGSNRPCDRSDRESTSVKGRQVPRNDSRAFFPRVRYDECEALALDNCHLLRPEQVLPNPDEQTELCEALRQRVVGKEAELQDLAEQVENLMDQIARTKNPEMRDRYETRVARLETQMVRSILRCTERTKG